MNGGKDERIGIGGVFPQDDPDGSKARKELEKMGLKEDSPQVKWSGLSGGVVFVGLDLSLTSSGWAVKRGKEVTVGTIKTEPKDFPNDLARMVYIRNAVLEKIPVDVKMICVEDFFAGIHPGSGTRLAMLAAIVRLAVYERKMSFVVVSPNSLKKWILGKGVGQKDLIVREIYKRYQIEVANDDEADGVVLACIAEHFFRVLKGDKIDAPKYQQEVAQNMMKTRSERGFNLS